MNAFSKSGVHAPEDLFNLEKENLRLSDGDVWPSSGASKCHCINGLKV